MLKFIYNLIKPIKIVEQRDMDESQSKPQPHTKEEQPDEENSTTLRLGIDLPVLLTSPRPGHVDENGEEISSKSWRKLNS